MGKVMAVIVVGLILFLGCDYIYAQEKITLSTYYPAPYGEYRKLAIGSSTGGYTAPTSDDIDLVVEGNVGIGTTSPGANLEIETASGDAALHIDAHGVGDAPVIRFQRSGTNKWGFISDTNDDRFRVWDYTNSLERVTIATNGNVGIGTATPNSSKGSGGYLDTKDVYLRDTGKWASEAGGLSTYVGTWFPINTGNTYNINHDLGAVPTLVFLYIAENSDGSGRRASGNGSNDHGVDGSGSASYHSRRTTICYIDASTIKIRTGISGICFVRDENGNWWGPSSGYARIIAMDLE